MRTNTKRRVVITGLGVVAPNAINLSDFKSAIQKGISGIKHIEELEELKFSCQIAGKPEFESSYLNNYFKNFELRGLASTGLEYGVIAGMDAWKDAGMNSADQDGNPLWSVGIIFGTGILGVDKFREAIYKVDEGKVRRLGSNTVIQTMASGISATLAGKIGAGNMVTTNSSACSTGTEAVLLAYQQIQQGQADMILAGSTSDSGPYVWGGFDAMRILPNQYNKNPTEASRPLSASAAGFVPGSGAGALVIEDLEHALKRGAKIYAEIAGGHINNGGQRNGGSMTAPNPEAVKRCIEKSVLDSGIVSEDIDAINGHLTATTKDPLEIENWAKALNRFSGSFPYINSLKGLIGHCLAASGSIECVASVLQISEQFIFGNKNCEDIHPEILNTIDRECIPLKTLSKEIKYLAKASFGFGDVNACVIFKQY